MYTFHILATALSSDEEVPVFLCHFPALKSCSHQALLPRTQHIKGFDTLEPIPDSLSFKTLCLVGSFSMSGKVSLIQYYTTFPIPCAPVRVK